MGFDLCGVVRAEKFPELDLAKEWLARGYAGEMKYLADERRANPQSVMPGIRSVIVCALNYNSSQPRSLDVLQLTSRKNREAGSLAMPGDRTTTRSFNRSSKAWPKSLPLRFTEPHESRVYADTGPSARARLRQTRRTRMDRQKYAAAQRKARFLVFSRRHPDHARYSSVPLSSRVPSPGSLWLMHKMYRCLSHRRPRRALPDGCPPLHLLLTIEHRSSIPENLREPMGLHVFGCDICQDVCPWNRRAPITQAEEFQPRTFPRQSEITQPKYQLPFASSDEEESLLSAASRMAGRARRSSIPRTISRKSNKTHQMARPVAQRMHCPRQFARRA